MEALEVRSVQTRVLRKGTPEEVQKQPVQMCCRPGNSAEIRASRGKPVKHCFVCDKRLGKNPRRADTHEDQTVYVGSECYKLIQDAGELGYPIGN